MNHWLPQALGWMPFTLALVLPLHPRASTWLLLAWLPLWLVAGWKGHWRREAWTATSTAMVALYALMALGVLWSSSQDEALFALEVKAALLILPLLRLTWGLPRRNWQQGWMLGLSAIIVFRVAASLVGWPESGWRYAEWTGPFHPTYLAMYWGWGICLARGDRSRWLVPLFAAAIGLSASKAGWMGGGLALLSLLPKGRSMWGAVLLGGLALLATATWADQGRLGEFVAHAPQVSESNEVQAVAPRTGSTGGRMQAWSVALELWAEHPFLGVGTGDYGDAAQPLYEAKGMEYAAEHHMNAHNAYFQIAVTLGILGLSVMLWWWSAATWAAWRSRSWGLAACMLLLAFNALFESVLELQQGIVAAVFLSSMAGDWHQVPKESHS